MLCFFLTIFLINQIYNKNTMDTLLPYINPESAAYEYEDCNDVTYTFCECISVTTNFDFMDIAILII